MSQENKGLVFNIQRLSVHDGPGIRTTVFLKGCPLNCLWCHNPESKIPGAEISFSEKLCIGCRRCQRVCEFNCHIFINNRHTINRNNCILCGKCVRECVGALEIIGREMACEEVMAEVLKDRKFYENSNGGMTISGGEPLYQFVFTRELLKQAKTNCLHTCIETSGFADYDKLRDIMEYVDYFLYDWKETNEALHKSFTGVSNHKILKNLLNLNDDGAKIILRCPIVPNYNNRQEHLLGISDIANRCKNVLEINVQPYNPFGQSKCDSIGCKYALPAIPIPSDDEIKMWIDQIQSRTNVPVKGS